MRKEVDNAFRVQAKGRIPDWAEPMIEYSDAVEWMRRQHWKNNRKRGNLRLAQVRGPLLAGLGTTIGKVSHVPSARPGPGLGLGMGIRLARERKRELRLLVRHTALDHGS